VTNPNIHKLGTVHDWDGSPRPVGRLHDGLTLGEVGTLLPAGVRELEKLITGYWTDLARWRTRNLDLETYRIDLDDCRETIATLPGVGDAADFSSVDWHEVGKRLDGLRQFGGYGELSRLHALLTCDDPELFRG
jgi:hypothetical protein